MFVGNLPAETPARKVKALFRPYGEVEAVRFRSLSLINAPMQRKTAVIMRKKAASEGSAVHAYVVFKEHEAAHKALEANGTELGGHVLRVDRADRPPEFEQARSVFLGNLPFDATEQDVREAMAPAGMVEAVRIVRDKVCARDCAECGNGGGGRVAAHVVLLTHPPHSLFHPPALPRKKK